MAVYRIHLPMFPLSTQRFEDNYGNYQSRYSGSLKDSSNVQREYALPSDKVKLFDQFPSAKFLSFQFIDYYIPIDEGKPAWFHLSVSHLPYNDCIGYTVKVNWCPDRKCWWINQDRPIGVEWWITETKNQIFVRYNKQYDPLYRAFLNYFTSRNHRERGEALSALGAASMGSDPRGRVLTFNAFYHVANFLSYPGKTA